MGLFNNLVEQFTHQGQSQGQGQNQGGGYGRSGQSSYNQQSYGQPPYGQQQSYGQPQYGGYPPQSYNNNDRPNPPEPWIAEWDQQASTWVFVNRQTGQRTHEFPRGGGGYSPQPPAYGAGYPPPQQGYNQGPGGYPPQQQEYGNQGGYGSPAPQQQYGQQPEPPKKKDHSGRNTAIGVAAGLAGGALLMHEGHKVGEFFT